MLNQFIYIKSTSLWCFFSKKNEIEGQINIKTVKRYVHNKALLSHSVPVQAQRGCTALPGTKTRIFEQYLNTPRFFSPR